MTSAIDPSKFPSSTARPSALVPFPGITPASTKTVRHLLERNNRENHIMQKTIFFHNHLAHHLLTAYNLGASEKLLKDIFTYEEGDQASIFRQKNEDKEPIVITEENWASPEYLGNVDAYAGYVAFFHEEIKLLSPRGALDKYIFSSAANSGGKNNASGPRMMLRLFGGVLHPFIHVGFGVEFDDPIIIAEGLAMAAIHSADLLAKLFPDNFPHLMPHSRRGSMIHERHEMVDNDGRRHPSRGLSALEIYGLFMESRVLDPGEYDPDAMVNDRLKNALKGNKAHELQDLVSLWDIDEQGGPEEWESRLEEVAFLGCLLGTATGRIGYKAKIDFFLMHLTTSSLFLSSMIRIAPGPVSKKALLTSWLSVALHTSLARGRPEINPEYIMSQTEYPGPPSSSESTTNSESIGELVKADGGNPWLRVIATSLHAHDSHVPKTIRALLYGSLRYGHTPAGSLIGTYTDHTHDINKEKETIPGISSVDGSVFIRAAGLAMEVAGWTDAGEHEGAWDRSALGYDASWTEEDEI